MKFNITDNEKKLIKRFKEMNYPSIYKDDSTDNLLFIETVDFVICPIILEKKIINKSQYNDIINDFNYYLSQVNLEIFDEYALEHYNYVLQIMDIFQKYYKDISIL